MEPNIHRPLTVEIAGWDWQYNARVGTGIINEAGTLVAAAVGCGNNNPQNAATSGSGCRCAVIADRNTRQFSGKLLASLTSCGIEATLITILPGEQAKNLEQVGQICDEMIAAGLDRQSFVIGLGGGVIGDISGFVAAIFQRGIPHVQIPTTLLAMVDSSIGGKTGVNTAAGKNLIGAVHHPALVIDDVDVLRKLPEREFRQGFAEIIKHAVVADAQMFTDLAPVAAGDAPGLQLLIKRNISIKASIVARDEQDRSGERAVLNFGHTVGHGIERAGEYRTFLHGEAISLGMVAAANVSAKRAGLSADERDAMIDLLQRFDLPTKLPGEFRRDKILSALKHDKKFESGQVRFVVTPKIGSAYLSKDVTLDDIEKAIHEL